MFGKILDDIEISRLCTNGESPMIAPFVDYFVDSKKNTISYGLKKFGYVPRLDGEFVTYDMANAIQNFGYIDPHNQKTLRRLRIQTRPYEGLKWTGKNFFTIPAHGIVLCQTSENIHLPDDVTAIGAPLPIYTRLGLIVTVPILDPGYNDRANIEIFNATLAPCRVYVGQGICQFTMYKSI